MPFSRTFQAWKSQHFNSRTFQGLYEPCKLESSPLLMCALMLQYSNSLWNASTKYEGGISQVHFWHQKLIGWPQNECQIYHLHPYVYHQFWKSGEDWSSTFLDIWRYMPIFAMGTWMSISRVTGLQFIKFLHNVVGSSVNAPINIVIL